MLQQCQQKTPATNSPCHRYAGLLVCGDCGGPFVGINRDWNGKRRVEYICKSYMRHGKTICPVGISGISKEYPIEMNPREAAYATQWVGPDVVIPTHYAPGSEALQKYMDCVKVTSPQTIVKTAVDTPWTYTPFQIN